MDFGDEAMGGAKSVVQGKFARKRVLRRLFGLWNGWLGTPRRVVSEINQRGELPI